MDTPPRIFIQFIVKSSVSCYRDFSLTANFRDFDVFQKPSSREMCCSKTVGVTCWASVTLRHIEFAIQWGLSTCCLYIFIYYGMGTTTALNVGKNGDVALYSTPILSFTIIRYSYIVYFLDFWILQNTNFAPQKMFA